MEGIAVFIGIITDICLCVAMYQKAIERDYEINRSGRKPNKPLFYLCWVLIIIGISLLATIITIEPSLIFESKK